MDETLIDPENYRSNEDAFGFKEIAMKQFQKVITNMSQEMREGIRIYSHVKMREPEIIRYLPDTRKQFLQSMDCLHDILFPKFDKATKELSKKLLKRISEIKEESDSKEEYWINKLKIYRELFQSICLFFDGLGWLESGAIED